jgi:hypothetical protein
VTILTLHVHFSLVRTTDIIIEQSSNPLLYAGEQYDAFRRVMRASQNFKIFIKNS